MDEVLYKTAEKIKKFAVTYLVDITKVPDFNTMYELYDPITLMFFFRNKHMMIDLGTGIIILKNQEIIIKSIGQCTINKNSSILLKLFTEEPEKGRDS